MSDTTAAKKGAIVALKEAGMSNREVADKENVAPLTVSRINARGTSKAPKKGCPIKMDCRDIQKALQMLSSGRAENATDLQRKFFPHLHCQRRRLGQPDRDTAQRGYRPSAGVESEYVTASNCE
ncbi:hypothetical protein C8R46DRAFT_1035799 [Mycena filopes]|nr:hypothetical protein C8R46DRAFT_1035799 [Mycena filopes]